MAIQTVNVYAFCVRRAGSHPANLGEQVYVTASSLLNAQAVLTAQYGAGYTFSGGATPVTGALTTMTGS